ncbi:MAG: FliH/SctL family protein [Rickettsiales bacterium]|nr:FliH/SctL family protein [Rickettsiales bacterium]
MKPAPLHLREFGGGAAQPTAKQPKSFLPGGRFRGEAPPPPPAPSFTEAQYKQAQSESYRKGFLEGTEEGKKQEQSEQAIVERKLMESLSGVLKFSTPLYEDYRATILHLQHELPKIALAIARKVAGLALTENSAQMIEELTSRCVESMAGEPKLTITVHSSLGDALEKKLTALVESMQAKTSIVIIRDDAMPIDNCRVEWRHGEFARDTAKLWQEIERVVEGLSATATFQTEQHMQTVSEQLNQPDLPKE